ncbi:MAG: YezD family protein [Treponema sp.]|jgi:hypothetical protein|nr:YezD family protein [Treponema sp.]
MAEGTERKELPGALDEKGLKELNQLLASLNYGSVTLIIQNGKVVQIEKNEKLRLT